MATETARAEPYIRYADDEPLRQWAALNNSMSWTAFHLLQGGAAVRENADRCPRTMAFVAEIERTRVKRVTEAEEEEHGTPL